MSPHRCTVLFILTLALAPAASARELRDALVEAPAVDSPEFVIQRTLEAGVKGDFEGWYGTWCHVDYCLGTPRNKDQFLLYRWKQFVKFADSYVVDAAKTSYRVTHTTPATFDDASATELKVFVKSTRRDNPSPIILRKDEKGAWKVFNMSL